MDAKEFDAVVNKFLVAIEQQDEAALRDCYNDDAKIWHNFTNTTISKEENVGMLTSFWALGVRLSYEFQDQAVEGTRGARRHWVTATTLTGRALRFSVAMFITVQNGRIAQIDEYVDSKEVEAINATLQAELAAATS